MQAQRIQSVKKIGIQDTIDIEVNHADHNFMAEGIVTSNSHATAYSLQGYCSAYLKYYYPLPFFTSALSMSQYEQKPLEELFDYSSELQDFDITLLPPSIDKVSNKFRIEEKNIRYPIGLIRGLGEELYKKLETLTENQLKTFDSCIEALINSGLNSRSIEFSITCGALDKFGVSREDALLFYWFLSDLQPEVLEKFWIYKNGSSLSVEVINTFLNYKTEEVINKKGKIRVKSYFKTEITREKTIKRFQEYSEIVKEYKQNQKLAYYVWEMNALGYSNFYNFSNSIKTFRQLDAMDLDDKGSSFGFVEEIMHRRSAKGNEYGIYVLKFDKRQNFMFFGHAYAAAKSLIKEGDYVTFTAKKEIKGLNVETIKRVTEQIQKYEFYKKEVVKSAL